MASPVRTRITTLFQCKYPILLPGMSWISTSELVAAVSNAGGLGILATGPLNAKETAQSIDKIRSLTDQPFGIGATLLMPGAAENAQVGVDLQVPVLNTSLGKADLLCEQVHAYGGKVLSTVTNAKHAGAALAGGADALLLTGHEAAAHGGDVTSLVLIPSLRQAFPNVPLVAAGGFANGPGLAGALALGADAVAMGSRFAVTAQSPLAHATKEAIVAAGESETVYGRHFDGIPARVLATPTSQRLMKRAPWFPVVLMRAFAASKDMGVPLWKVLPGLLTAWDKMYMVAQFGAATEALKAATMQGDLDEGVQFIGQCQGLIQDIPDVEELVQRIMMEAQDASQETAGVFGSFQDQETAEVQVANA